MREGQRTGSGIWTTVMRRIRTKRRQSREPRRKRENGNKKKRDQCGQANGVGMAGKPPITERSWLVPEEHE